MKLDPKISSIKDVLTPFDDGSGEVGEYCAFANYLEDFQNLEECCTFGTLKRYNESNSHPFEFEATISHAPGAAKFCLPYHKVNKWRPFESLGEFRQKFPLGSEIRYRDGEYVKTQLFTDYWTDSNGKAFVKIGGEMVTFKKLFEYTLIEGEDSHPFGVRQ